MGQTRKRCGWAADDGILQDYHDREWGTPVDDDRTLFEFLILEGAQAGLSWATILNKRAGYQTAFHGFDPIPVARFGPRQQAALLRNEGIVRNRLKIQSAIDNAQAFLQVQDERGSFASYLWDFVDGKPLQNHWRRPQQVPASTPLSDQISKDLKRRGFRFVGSTIVYAYLQAVGLVNDHLRDCFRHGQVTALGRRFRCRGAG